jgi:hypothetical protein
VAQARLAVEAQQVQAELAAVETLVTAQLAEMASTAL